MSKKNLIKYIPDAEKFQWAEKKFLDSWKKLKHRKNYSKNCENLYFFFNFCGDILSSFVISVKCVPLFFVFSSRFQSSIMLIEHYKNLFQHILLVLVLTNNFHHSSAFSVLLTLPVPQGTFISPQLSQHWPAGFTNPKSSVSKLSSLSNTKPTLVIVLDL